MDRITMRFYRPLQNETMHHSFVHCFTIVDYCVELGTIGDDVTQGAEAVIKLISEVLELITKE